MRTGTYSGLRSEVTATVKGRDGRRIHLGIAGSGALKVPGRDAYFVPVAATVTTTPNGRGAYAVVVIGYQQRPASGSRPARLTRTRCWRMWDFDALHSSSGRLPASVEAAVKAALNR